MDSRARDVRDTLFDVEVVLTSAMTPTTDDKNIGGILWS